MPVTKLTVKFLSRLVLVSMLLLVLSGCASSKTSPQQPAPASPSQLAPWNSDGIISENEYKEPQQLGSIEVFTRIEGDYVCLAMRAQNTGYIALGIRPENAMMGADVIMCTVNGDQAVLTDAYSTGPTGPHPADLDQGGTSDIISASGSLKNGWLTCEFKRKLSTGDSRDKDLLPGDNPVIWATGGSADITVRHKTRGYGKLVLH
ncbi:MAG TPA: hypothetical protein DCR95_00215 [Desulfobacter sp.]|nr:hypothetical protein [Desulfobacter sp.]